MAIQRTDDSAARRLAAALSVAPGQYNHASRLVQFRNIFIKELTDE